RPARHDGPRRGAQRRGGRPLGRRRSHRHRHQRARPEDLPARPRPLRHARRRDPLGGRPGRRVGRHLARRRRPLPRGRCRRRAHRRGARAGRRPRHDTRVVPGGGMSASIRESLRGLPGPFFGDYGGRFMPESLIAAIDELAAAYEDAKADPAFRAELDELHRSYTGRPSIITEVPRFAEHAGGARVFLKREDLNHTGSHKINNVLGQALLTRRIGKTRVIAETGAGQHGVATATAAALFGLECTVYMGEEDTRRQALNVARMRLLGAEVIPVTTGSRTLKDAINEAMRDWVTNVATTNSVFGTVAGPHPFPALVRDLQKIIGEEARDQVLELTGRLPDVVAACVG